jgi:hypothetical protein
VEEDSMTTLTLATFTDGFTVAPTQRTFNARTGITFTGGDTLAQTAYEWWLYKDGGLIDSCFAGGVYSTLCTETGDYTLICRIFCASGGYEFATAEDRVDWTVGPAAIIADMYVDSATGNDSNPGTEASPKLTIAGAATAIGSAWVTNGEHRIYLRAGQTHACSGSVINYTHRTGRIIVDRYGAGAKPDIVHTGGGSFAVLNNGVFGGVMNCQTHGGRTGSSEKGGFFINAQTNDTTNSSLGSVNVILYNVDCYGWDRLIELWHFTTMTRARVDAGYADNIAVVNTSAHDSRAFHHYYSYVQNLLIRDCYLGDYHQPTSGSLIRVNGFNRVYIRGTTEPLTRTDANAAIRLHGALIEEDLDYDGRDVVVTQCKLSSVAATEVSGNTCRNRYMWFAYNRMDSRTVGVPTSDQPIWLAASYCWVHGNRSIGRSTGIGFQYSQPTYVGPQLDVFVSNNNFVAARTASEFGRPVTPPAWTGASVPTPAMTGFYCYNNAGRKLDETTRGQFYRSGNKNANDADWQTDYNLFQFGGSPADWSNSVPGITGTLAQWQALGKETNSAQGVDLAFVSTTDVDDLIIGAGSAAIDAGTPMLYARVDCFGKLRNTSGWDVGAHERGATAEPVAPSLGGGGESKAKRTRLTVSMGVGL